MKLLLPFLLSCFLLAEDAIEVSKQSATGFKGEIKFSIRNAGLQVPGTMEIQSVEIAFNTDNLNQSFINAKANPSTIQTGISIRDKHLKRSDYFNVDKYPEIKLRSQSFKKIAKNKFIGRFTLTIKGITKTIAIPFVRTQEKNAVRYKGNFEINRLNFNLGEQSSILDENVIVSLDVRSY